MKKKLSLGYILAIFILVFPASAFAHRVSIFAWVDGDTIRTESKFSGSRMVKGGIVKVFDMEENLLLEGTTDENGEFSFKIPERAPLRIELIAGTGHGNEWLITADDIGASELKTAKETPAAASIAALEKTSENTVAETRISQKEMEEIVEKAVEKAVDQKLKPVMKILSDMSDPGPEISDIFGGIGYIIGLVGIGAYFGSRRKSGANNQ